MIGALIGGAIGGFIGGAIGSSANSDGGTHYHTHLPPKINHQELARNIVEELYQKCDQEKRDRLHAAKTLEWNQRKTCAKCNQEIKIIGILPRCVGVEVWLKCGCHEESVIISDSANKDRRLLSNMVYSGELAIQKLWGDYYYGGNVFPEFAVAVRKFVSIYDVDERNGKAHPVDVCQKEIENMQPLCICVDSRKV